jgi:hypothetical protein
MSMDALEYEDESIVEIKIDVSPGDTLPASALVVRDASNRVRHRIALTPDIIGTWIDLTEHVRTAGQGRVEAELLGDAGHAQWNGKLSVRTRPPRALAEPVVRGEPCYAELGALSRRKA